MKKRVSVGSIDPIRSNPIVVYSSKIEKHFMEARRNSLRAARSGSNRLNILYHRIEEKERKSRRALIKKNFNGPEGERRLLIRELRKRMGGCRDRNSRTTDEGI